MTEQKLPVFATKMNQKMISHRLKTTELGHKLLKSKSDALQSHFRKIQNKFEALNLEVETVFKNAFLSMSRARFLGANIQLFEKTCLNFPISMKTEIKMVSGVQLPNFRVIYPEFTCEFLEKGGSQLLETRRLFTELINLLIEVCSVKNSFLVLKATLDATNRRVNSLEHLMIPRLESTMRFITTELDEQEREDFFRLKKIQQKNNKK